MLTCQLVAVEVELLQRRQLANAWRDRALQLVVLQVQPVQIRELRDGLGNAS
jgi:hypothetical protein